eukprot:gnl/MRDRNA2_/MRDRNA2_344407_c0_seq1.p1 gnl/MRDRNA2_/MRDRNA2_344407_c0~~gnl/MRDRNA2_/MRDRNA2_344407_c0_seq1.p1  ORF type:complete len:122 (-),score=19.72 gnl/MRDRNA2_/MRDRNA2_344407_c0_seq1:77-442(-)
MLPSLAFLTSSHGSIVALRIGLEPLSPHGPEQSNCAISLGAFFTSTDSRAEADDFRHDLFVAHGLHNHKSIFPLLTFPTTADCCSVADAVQRCPSLAFPKDLQRKLPLTPSSASMNTCVVL